MPSEFAPLLMKRALDFVTQLQSAGIAAVVQGATLRDFSVKLDLPEGKAVLYYKAKKDSFQCLPEKVEDQALWARVLACWEANGSTVAPSGGAEQSRPDGAVEVFVDGSWVNGTTSYGVVVVQGDVAVWEGAGVLTVEEAGTQRQVGGELEAVRAAVHWCRDHGITKVIIHYDYTGIEHWVTGTWKAKTPLTQRYKADIQNSGIEITWNKVAAHTGVKWNERADTLANDAASKASGQKVAPEMPALPEVIKCVTAFAAFLRPHGLMLEICHETAAPTPHVRAAITSGSDAWGFLNVYASAGKAPYPKFHEVRPAEKQQMLEQWWRQYKAPAADDLDEVNYYLHLFEPYAGLEIDFGFLVEALERVWDVRMDRVFDRDHLRCNFARLKECADILRKCPPTESPRVDGTSKIEDS